MRICAPEIAIRVLLIVILPLSSMSQPQGPDSAALLRFKETLPNGLVLETWKPNTSPCNGDTANWEGVLCNGGFVWGIQLEGKGLTGQLNIDPLVPMRYLRTLSLMNNDLNGPMPAVKKLNSLKSLFLSNNRFSGEMPGDAFEGMGSLKKVFLANNAFRGRIPSSLATLPRLMEVRLNGNQFEGEIPDFEQKDLKLARFENNDLTGPIPESLKTMDPSSFAGNKDICGPPLGTCSPRVNSQPPPAPAPARAPAPAKKSGSIFAVALVMIILGIILLLVALIIFLILRRKRESRSASLSLSRESSRNFSDQNRSAEVTSGRRKRAQRSDHGKLHFLSNDIQRFGLQDLLKSSAEVLGSGTFGASYKASVPTGETVVVKRFKQMNNVGREEFQEHMRRLGRLRHPNLLPIVSYHYRREEKLLVTEFVHNGSLASHLHVNHSIEEPGLEWPTRLKIIKGVARCLCYLYAELPMLTIPHGHLKSSNVLLDDSFEPFLTDYALRPLINSEHAHTLMTAYKSPDSTRAGRITRKTDVWCLGILILEILSGKFPESYYLTQGYDGASSLATWVSEMVKDKKTSEIFDREIMEWGKKGCKAEMIGLLKIGMSCCEEEEERRMELKEAAEKIEELGNGGNEEDQFGGSGRRVFYASRVSPTSVMLSP